MRFYNREKEIEELKSAATLSQTAAQFTVVTGRRRIGKTRLIREAYKENLMLYFFVARKSEKELCQGFKKEIEQKLNIPILGEITHFYEIFEFLLKFSINVNFTLFIDEFQEFFRINPSIYSDMQRLWDQFQDRSKMNLIVCGSIYNMMTKIFKDSKEPLYNRENRFMMVKPFKLNVLKEILKDYNRNYTPEDLLALYVFTGGVAKYIQILMEGGATTKVDMIKGIINENSSFIGEGKALLIEEFGKEYGIYFSILSAISFGKTSRSEIENAVGKEVGGYLSRLEVEYEIIDKVHPIFELSRQKNIRYVIKDNFLQFWFRFIFRYQYMIEIDAYDSLEQIIIRDYETYSGSILEKYFRQLISESGKITRIGSWWDRKGHNEIDIVAENELNKSLLIGEVKRNINNYDEREVREKSQYFFNSVGNFRDYNIVYKGFSMEDL